MWQPCVSAFLSLLAPSMLVCRPAQTHVNMQQQHLFMARVYECGHVKTGGILGTEEQLMPEALHSKEED